MVVEMRENPPSSPHPTCGKGEKRKSLPGWKIIYMNAHTTFYAAMPPRVTNYPFFNGTRRKYYVSMPHDAKKYSWIHMTTT
jgi:hypothetical protein